MDLVLRGLEEVAAGLTFIGMNTSLSRSRVVCFGDWPMISKEYFTILSCFLEVGVLAVRWLEHVLRPSQPGVHFQLSMDTSQHLGRWRACMSK